MSNAVKDDVSIVGKILDGAGGTELVAGATALLTGDGLLVDKNDACVEVEDYRIPLSAGGGGDPAAGQSALLTTQQARAAAVMMRTALRLHSPQTFIDYEGRRIASADACPADRGVGTQVPLTQMGVVILPSNENGFCLTGSDDMPFLQSILHELHYPDDTQNTNTAGSPFSQTPLTSTGSTHKMPRITVYTNERVVTCDTLLMDAVVQQQSQAEGGSQLGLPTSLAQLSSQQSCCNNSSNLLGDGEETVIAGEGGGDCLSGMEVASSNNYGEELVRNLHRNQKHAMGFLVAANEC